ncbi:MAG: hypothetical protein R3215_14255 [Halomonas sp.]|nr:hypothetical protein [Halomonas sp.]
MRYGKRPEGMDDGEWLIECQCRHVAREMRAGRDRTQRGAIFEQWQKRLPAISKARVAEIWRAGVPMPGQAKKEKAA